MSKNEDTARKLNGMAGEMYQDGSPISLYEVDWKAVYVLETVAPMRVAIPPFQARARCEYIEAWRQRVQESYPGEGRQLDSEWMSYVIIYRDGKDSPIPVGGNTPYKDRVERWRWIDPTLLFMNGLNAEVAAVYQIENIAHTEALLIWSRRHHLLAKIPEKDAGEIALEGCIQVKLVPEDEIESL